MEYVDGEDLASLLRRIGRVSSEKALDMIRQLAAGLAAAHDLGVLHRDFKPANIMIDGRGHVRIMDFGLAAFVEEVRGEKGFAGTIGYMSPEQLAGQGATMRSDVYSLGLVMYEILTGKKPYDARTLEGLRDLQAAGPPAPPSEYVSDLEPAMNDLVMWCLERDPAKRPSTARAAASAMPGMDPLAAAMAAGETPSVEMVAAAGGQGGLTTGVGVFVLGVIIIGFLAIALLNDYTGLFRLAPLPEPPVYLSRQARKVLSDIGLEKQPADDAHGYLSDQELLTYIQETDSLPNRWDKLRTGRRSVYRYWYRESPWPLVPLGITVGRVSTDDPPPLSPGMAEVRMDAYGRLTKLQVVRPLESEHYSSSEPTEWSPLFAAAGVDTALLDRVEKESWDLTYQDSPLSAPRLRFHVLADEMIAWEGVYSEDSDDRITVWAAAYRGLPVYFSVTTEYGGADTVSAVTAAVQEDVRTDEAEPGEGDEADGRDTSKTVGTIIAWVFGIGALLLMLLPIALMARAQLRAGRGDRRGAYRFGLLLLPMLMIDWLFAAHHTTDPSGEIMLFVTSLGMALFGGIFFGAAYLALEPYMRKYWPDGLISWARLIGGKYRDPIVGRDVILGAAAGVLLKILWQFRFLIPKWLGAAPARPANIVLETINGIGPAIAEFFSPAFMIIPIIGVIGLVLLRILLRKRGVAVTVFAIIVIVIPVIIILVSSDNAMAAGTLTALAWIITVLGVSLVFVKLGLLATIAMFFFFVKLENFPITLDSSAWYMGTSTAVLFALGALALWAFTNAITRSSRIQNQP
jgi:serine/threonine-protein kinase